MTKGSLKSHMQSMHEGVNYPCDLCDYKAKQSPGLKRHMALVHNIGKELLCEQCDFQTRLNEKLKKHVKINSDDNDIFATSYFQVFFAMYRRNYCL